MKKILFAAMMLLAGVINISAQDAQATQTIEEPEFEFEPYTVNAEHTGLDQALPCENAYGKAKAGASVYMFGIGKVKSYYYVDGTASKLALTTNDCIVINTGGKSPLQTLTINKFDIMSTKRRFQNGEAGTFTGAQTGSEGGETFKYKKFGKASVLIPLSTLTPGQYCLTITNSMTNSKSQKVYTFSISQ